MRKQTQRRLKLTSGKWLYASVTLVGLSTGALLVTQPIEAATRVTDGSSSGPQTATVAATSTSSTTPSASVKPTTTASTATSTADTVAKITPQTTVTTAVQPDKLAVGVSRPTRQARETPTYALRHQFLRRQVQPTTPVANATPAVTETKATTTTPTTAAVTPVHSAATEAPTVTSTLTYQLNAGGDGYIVTGLQQPTAAPAVTAITIPDRYLGKPVSVIGAGAFNGDGLTSVTLGNNLQWIEADAFANNKLKTVKMTDGIWSVGDNAFSNNDLTSVDLNHVSAINIGAFAHNAIASLVIPETVTAIANNAFEDNAIRQLTLGPNVGTIGTAAFADNQIAGPLTLPAKLTALGDNAFNTNQLTAVHGLDQLTVLNTGVFANNRLSGKLALPASITSVGDMAFANNQLTGLTLDDALTSIGTDAFTDNRIENSLTLPANLTELGDGAFATNRLTSVTLNAKITRVGIRTFADNQLTGTLNLPDNIVNVGTDAFANNQLTGLTGGTQVKTIEARAFYNNKLTGTLDLADTVTSIGAYAFANNALQTLTGGAGLITINDHAFQNNRLSGTLTLSDSLTDVGAYAFENNQLTELDLQDNVNSLANYSFADNDLKKITAAGVIGTIGDYAFAGQRQLDNVQTWAWIVNVDGAGVMTIHNVKAAIKKKLGTDIDGLQFKLTDSQQVATYDSTSDTLKLPAKVTDATVTVSLVTGGTDTGRYSVDNLTFVLRRHVKADVDIPSNLRDDGMLDMLIGMKADKVPSSGIVGTIQTIAVPKVGGYNADRETIPALVNADGTITALEKVDYEPDLTPGGGGHDTPGDSSKDQTGTDKTPTTPDVTPTTPPTTPETPTTDDAAADVPVTPDQPVAPTPTTSGNDDAIPLPPSGDANQIDPHQVMKKRATKPSQKFTPATVQHTRLTPATRWGRVATPVGTFTSVRTAGRSVVQPLGTTRKTTPATVQPVAQRLPQTNEQQSIWQWVGAVLLAGLSWFGLARKQRHE